MFLQIAAISWIFERHLLSALGYNRKNLVVTSSKPLVGSKVNSVFHPSEVDRSSARNFWGFIGKE